MSSLSILSGGIFLGISTSSANLFENPLYYVSIMLIILGIFVQATMNVKSESKINNLTLTEFPEVKSRLNVINSQLESIQSHVDALQSTFDMHKHPFGESFSEYVNLKLELENLKKEFTKTNKN